MATTQITAAIPMVMPSTVRRLRVLLRSRSRYAASRMPKWFMTVSLPEGATSSIRRKEPAPALRTDGSRHELALARLQEVDAEFAAFSILRLILIPHLCLRDLLRGCGTGQ